MSENSLGEAVEAWEAGGGELCYNQESERWEHQGLSWLQWILSFFGGIDYEAMLVRSGVDLITYGTTINDTIKGKVNALFEKQFGRKLFGQERVISLPTEEQLKEIDKQHTYLYLEDGVWKTKELGFISRILRWVGLAYQETRLGVLVTIFSQENFEDEKLDQISKLFQKRFGKSFNEAFFVRRQINQLIPKILERDILPQEGERVAEIKEPPLTPVSWKMGNLILSEWTGLPVEFKQDSDEPMAFFIALMEKYAGHFSGKGQIVLQELKQELKKGRAINYALENATTLRERRALSHAIIEELKKEKRLFFPVGYHASPAGHRCFLQLDLQERNGKHVVSGRITNTGEGLETYHQTGARGHRQGYVLELELGEIPLASLQSSNFFVIASELLSLKSGGGNTNYRIEDFYEGLISAWPGTLSHPKNAEVRAPQYGKTCEYKAILKSCKGRLSPDDRRLLTFFADYEALLLLEAEKGFLKQCKEGASRLCRRALKLSRGKLLSQDIVNELREKTKRYRLDEEKIERERVYLQNPESLLVKQNQGAHFSVGHCQNGTDWRAVSGGRKKAPSFSKETLAIELERVEKELQELKNTRQYSLELQLIRNVMQKLPSVDDPFWETEQAKKVLTPLSHILKRFISDVYGSSEGPLEFSSNSVALLIKGFVIATKIASKELPENLTGFFKAVIRTWYVDGSGFLRALLSPTDPYLVEELKKAFDYLEKNEEAYDTSNGVFGRYARRDNNEPYNPPWWGWIIEDFQRLSDILDHPQMSYLYHLLKSDPKLKDVFQKTEGALHKGADVPNTTKLFGNDYEKNLPPAYIELRRVFYALLFPLTRADVVKSTNGSYYQCNQYQQGQDTYRTALASFPHEENKNRPAVFVGYSFGKDFKKYAEDLLSDVHNWSMRQEQNRWLQTRASKETPVAMSPFEARLFYGSGLAPSLAAPLIIEYIERNKGRCRQPIFQSFLWMILCQHGVFLDLCKGSEERLAHFWNHLEKLEEEFARLGWVDAQIFITRLQGALLIQLEREKKGDVYYSKWMKTVQERTSYYKDKLGEAEYADGLVSIFAHVYPEQTSFFQSFIALVKELQGSIVLKRIPYFEWSAAAEEDIHFGRHLLKDLEQSNGKMELVKIPEAMTHHADFCLFLKGERFATLDENRCYLLSCKKGFLYKVKWVGKELKIYRQITFKGKKEWFEYVNRLPFFQRDVRTKKPFFEGKDGWLAFKEDKTVITDRETGEICYVVENDKLSPVAKGSPHPLYLQKENSLPFIERLTNFTNKENILLWSDRKGNLEEIELKEFGFSFLKDRNNPERWNSSLHPGYFLSRYKTTSELSPFVHYLLLENEEGDRKVIVSSRRVSPKASAHFDRRELGVTLTEQSPQCFTYSLSKKGTILFPEEGESLLYLLYLYLLKGDYDKSVALMRHFEALDLEFPAKSLIKEWANADLWRHKITHPIALPVLLRLDYYLNSSIGSNVSYIQHINNVGADPLTPEQEKRLRISFGGILHPGSSKSSPFRLCPYPSSEKAILDQWGKPFSFSSFTRPQEVMLTNFLNCYAIAKEGKGTKAYSDLKAVLWASSQDTTQPESGGIKHILQVTMEYPERMPSTSDVVMDFRKEGTASIQKLSQKCQNITVSSKLDSLKNTPPLSQKKEGSRLFATKPLKNIPFAPLNVKIESKGIIEEIPREYLKEVYIEQKTIQKDMQKIEELILIYKGKQGLSPSSLHQHERMVKGLEAKLAKLRLRQIGISKQIDPEKASALNTWIETKIGSIRASCKEKKGAIIELATDYKELELEREGGLHRPLTLEEMKRAFARGDHSPLLKSNPTLTEKDLKKIQEAMCELLLLETKMQQWERAHRQLIKCALAEDIEKEESAKEATAIAEQKRFFDQSSPHFHTLLVVENTLNLLIRKEQLDAIDALTKNPKNIIIEAGTGFGKTSLVIPIWAYLMQTQGKAPLIVLPKPLLRQMETLLRSHLGRSVGQIVKTWDVSRANIKSKEELEKLHDDYQRWQEKGACILMDDHSYHVLAHLKYRELLAEKYPDTKKIALLENIHKSILAKGAIFLEESTDVLDPKRRHDFSCGQPFTPPREDLSAIGDLYDFLLFETSVFDHYRLDFYPREGDESRIPITEAIYREKMRAEIAKAACKKLGISESPAAMEEIQGGSPKDLSFRKDWSEAKLKRYSIWRDFIGTYFEQTFSKPIEERYRLGKKRIAIPALRGTPKPTSQFSTIDHIAAFTLQMGIKKPIENSDVRLFIDTLKVLFMEEGEEAQRKYKEVFEWAALFLPKGKELLAMNEDDITQMTQILNKNPRERLKFTQFAVLSRLKTYPYKLSSSSHEAVLLSQLVQGGSGTVVETNPLTLTNHENPEAVIDNLLEIKKRSEIILSKESDLKKALVAIAQDPRNPTVLIDIAGKFLDLTDEEIGEMVFTHRNDIDHFAFYNREGERCLYEKHSKRVFKMGPKQPLPQNTFFYFSQPNVVGQDELFSKSSVAIATASNALAQDLFFQGSGRMRKLKEGQTIHYFLFENEWKLIPPKESPIDSLLLHVTSNKGEAQGKELFDSLEAIWKGILFSKLPPRGTNAHQQMMKFLEPLWKEKTTKDRLGALTRKKGRMQTKEAIAEVKKRLIAQARLYLPRSIQLEEVIMEFDRAVAKMKFPNEVLLSDQCGDEVEAEAEVELDLEMDLETTVAAEKEGDTAVEIESIYTGVGDLPAIDFEPAEPLPSDKWIGATESLKSVRDYYPNEPLPSALKASPNFFHIADNNPLIYKKVIKQSYQMVLIEKQGKWTVILTDIHDAAEAYQDLAEDKEGNKYLVGADGTLIRSNTSRPLDLQDPQLQELLFWAKPFTGDLRAPQHAKESYRKREDFKAWCAFVKKEILPVLPYLTEALSDLQE